MSDTHPTTVPAFVSLEDSLSPTDTLIVDGLDWSWAFVIYREIPGTWGYFAGSNGTVWSRRVPGGKQPFVLDSEWRRLKAGACNGYQYISVSKAGSTTNKSRSRTIHRIILDTFLGPHPHLQTMHHDGDRGNNRIRNLKFGTKLENESDKIRHGTTMRGERYGLAKLKSEHITEIRRQFAAGVRRRDIAAQFGITCTHVYQVAKRRNWAHIP
jgi:hypothetical protein